jgi:cytochrome b involved in lipid metabolism
MALCARVALLWAAAEGFHTPQTRLRGSSGCNTALSYADSDAAVDSSSDRIDALQQRAVESLRKKGDAAAVQALQADIEDSIVVIIDEVDVDVTSYAREHPGGAAVLRKFHGKDASKAFHAAKHSKAALDRMRALQPEAKAKPVSRASKLFTHEDRSQVHKVLGLWCLGHYVVRIHRGIWSADPTGGLTALSAVPWLLPHALLSLSSIKFHVPRERIAKKPMIWQEFRMHNIIFALRSFVCAALAAASLHASTVIRQRAAVGAACTVFASLVAADVATGAEIKRRARWRRFTKITHRSPRSSCARTRPRRRRRRCPTGPAPRPRPSGDSRAFMRIVSGWRPSAVWPTATRSGRSASRCRSSSRRC